MSADASRESGFSESFLAATVFVIGAGVMAIEITASRLLAPHFGASLFVWTSLIVTVLLAMSVGYWVGGSAAEKGAKPSAVGVALLAAAAMLLVGVLGLPKFSSAIASIFSGLTSASVALFLGSFFVAVISFATPVFLLAAAGPVMLKAWSAGSDIGRVSGKYFAVSTIGSVVGTVMPTIVLVPIFGAQRTFELVALLFFAFGALLLPRRNTAFAAMAFLPAITFVHVRGTHVPPNVIEERESPYQLIRVVGEGRRRFLVFNEGTGIQSVYDPDTEWTGLYFDYMSIVPLLRAPKDGVHRALILGLAGGSVARKYDDLLPTNVRVDMTGVEVDPAVIDVARRHFALDDTGIRVVNEDGRTFLHRPGEQYDVIVADAYSTQLYIPSHLATKEFFAEAKARLVPGGVFVMNINAPDRNSPLLKALVNSAASLYAHIRVVEIPGTWNNLVFVSDEPFDFAALEDRIPEAQSEIRDALRNSYAAFYDPAGEVFTDDRAPVEFLTDSMIFGEALRRMQ